MLCMTRLAAGWDRIPCRPRTCCEPLFIRSAGGATNGRICRIDGGHAVQRRMLRDDRRVWRPVPPGLPEPGLAYGTMRCRSGCTIGQRGTLRCRACPTVTPVFDIAPSAVFPGESVSARKSAARRRPCCDPSRRACRALSQPSPHQFSRALTSLIAASIRALPCAAVIWALIRSLADAMATVTA